MSEYRSVDQRGNYGHENPGRVLLASEKALSMLVWVLRLSFLTCNVSCLASLAPSVSLGLCGEQEVIPIRRKVYSCSKASSNLATLFDTVL